MRAAVHDVQLTLLITMGLVVLVIYLFLGRLGATAIPGVAVPISIISTFGAMHLLGYSIDNISLLALTLSVGLVVDDAIVMLENIVRHVEEGMTPFEAALKGSGEIGFTILSITLSLVAVFIPVLLMGGVVGRVFHEFAVTVTIAIAASAFVSLTLAPMLSRATAGGAAVPASSERNLFERSLRSRTARLRGPARPVPAGTAAASSWSSSAPSRRTVWMFRDIPKGFFPQEDIGQLSIQTQARQDISFPAMLALQARGRGGHRAFAARRARGLDRRRRRAYQHPQQRPLLRRAQAQGRAARACRRWWPTCAASWAASPVSTASSCRCRISASAAGQSKSQYQFVVQGLDRDELDDWAMSNT